MLLRIDGDPTMLRKLLLPVLAAATLAGCATDYAYRGGNGDYYYGQPRTEYRYYDPYGYYGGYAPGYYYDRYGRLIYGGAYGYYRPYYYGGWWQAPRPRPGHHGQDGDDDDHGDTTGRRPPWRDIGRMVPRTPGEENSRPRAGRQATPFMIPPQREQPMAAPPIPRMRGDEGGGSRMGRVIRNAKATPAPTDE